MTNFPTFFSAAFDDGRQPYDYQKRLACGEKGARTETEWLTSSGPCRSQLISIPTGLGKTAAVILAWLWNRLGPPSQISNSKSEIHYSATPWPRRLVYCLPMRTLVEQTRDEAAKWLRKHDVLWDNKGSHQGKVGLHILMGGEDTTAWDLYPEEPAILIGTQDMLLSRALNRGYGMSRYRWPMHFGLLNNDCLWVLDETQLMGVGVETSAQLDGFRSTAQWLRESPCPTWWMSATLEDSRLATVDHPAPSDGWPRLRLDGKDRDAVKHRLKAVKRLRKAPIVITKQTKPADLAKLVLDKHVEGQLTLAIVNRVQRAQELYEALQKAGRKDNLALVHSRFRAPDRKVHQDMLAYGNGDRIVVATQAMEAGVDVSARVLITELAPWSSLVQRFGRCNRGGEFNAEGADIHWLDLDFDKDADVAPYTLDELKDARTELQELEGSGVSPDALSSIQVIPPSVIRPVIRRKDLIDLFDTTPDIAGHDLDISRYIREGDETDVQVFWRDLSATNFKPSPDADEPTRAELCRVALNGFKAFLKKLNESKDGPKAYLWDGLREEWVVVTQARPGASYLLDHRAGGYEAQLGWTGEIARKAPQWVPVFPSENDTSSDANARDPLTRTGSPLTLEVHTQDVLKHMRVIAAALAPSYKSILLTAAMWHDVGKSLKEFQAMLRDAASGRPIPSGILAKSGKRGGAMPAWRRHFRHELASALAWLVNHDGASKADLTAYIIAAHHGKVRLSIRSLPGEQPPEGQPADVLMARGIVDGDTLPAVDMEGVRMPETKLRLDLMRMGSDDQGHPSWLARMIALRDELGPFALAYLETLLRSADMRASAEEASSATRLPQS